MITTQVVKIRDGLYVRGYVGVVQVTENNNRHVFRSSKIRQLPFDAQIDAIDMADDIKMIQEL